MNLENDFFGDYSSHHQRDCTSHKPANFATIRELKVAAISSHIRYAKWEKQQLESSNISRQDAHPPQSGRESDLLYKSACNSSARIVIHTKE